MDVYMNVYCTLLKNVPVKSSVVSVCFHGCIEEGIYFFAAFFGGAEPLALFFSFSNGIERNI